MNSEALVMGAAFLVLGLTVILRSGHVRETLDRLGEILVESVNRASWRQQSWHPCEMSDRGLRLAGVIVIAGATLFFYIAYLGFARYPSAMPIHPSKICGQQQSGFRD